MQGETAPQSIARAVKLVRDRHYESARTVCLQLCKGDRTNAQIWMLLGICNGQLGLYQEAVDAFRRAVELAPEQPHSHLNLAKALHANDELDAAASSYQNALNIDNTLAEAWDSLGQLKVSQKELPAAERCFRNIIALHPGDAGAHHKLAAVVDEQEKWQEALELYTKATELEPDLAEAWNNLGVIQQKHGQLKESALNYRKALAAKPDYAVAHHNLGTALHEQGSYTEAQHQFHKAIQINPDYIEAKTALGRTLHTLGRFSDGIKCYKEALAIDRRNTEALIGLGNALQSEGRFDGAYDAYVTAAAIEPESVVAIASQAGILEKKNRIDEAMACIQPLLDRNIRDTSLAVCFAGISKKLGKHEEAIKIIVETLERQDMAASERAELHFSLGEVLDDIGEYDRAFVNFRQANDLLPFSFDLDEYENRITEIISTFGQDAMQRLPRASGATGRPIFIVAMPRSGTTLVEQILSSHPDVHGGGELPYITEMAVKLCKETGTQLPYPDCINNLTQDLVNRFSRGYLEKLGSLSPDCRHITDKLPHNFMYLGLIELLFPQARVIHCLRNPMDTCLSIYTHHFNANHGYATDLSALGQYYHQYQRLMSHWRNVLSIPFIDIQYEELTSRQEFLTRKLVDFCGLPWNEACLEFHDTKRDVATPSYEQVRKPMYRTAVERWKNYDKHLAPLKEALGRDKQAVNG